MKIKKKDFFLKGINKAFIYKFFKNFTNSRENINRVVIFHFTYSLTFLNTENTDEILKKKLETPSDKY